MGCLICRDAKAEPEADINDVAVPDLERSALSCPTCNILLITLKEHGLVDEDTIRISNDHNVYRCRPTYGIHVLVTEAGKDYSTDRLVMRNLQDLDNEALLDVLRSGCTYTGSDLAVEWARSQIENCLEHTACKPRTNTCLPDRVLDIGPLALDNPGFLQADVRLYESSGIRKPYATLSHMWGGNQPLRLLQANIADFRARILFSALPRTFQQAIQFARKLGISYLWVDSLCIIQDCASDWREQSCKMATIYEDSYVTLAAATAENSLEGCFREPSQFLRGYVTDGVQEVAPENESEIRSMLQYGRKKPSVFIRGNPKHRSASRLEPEPLPLLRRGWVYQERLLSPRVLFFGDIDLLWECNESTGCYCKTWVSSGSRNVRSHPVKSQHARSLGLGSSDRTTPGTAELADRWMRISEEYSALNLTFVSDQLPAIAGVAKQLSSMMLDSTYASGHWTGHLVPSLSWAVHDYPPPNRRPEAKEMHCPSWSWLAPMARISFPQGYFTPSAETCPSVVATHLKQDGIDPYIDITHGSITLKGYLIEVRVRKIVVTGGYLPTRHGVSALGEKGFWQPLYFDLGEEAYAWNPILPRWVHKLPAEKLSLETSPPYQDLRADEDVDEEPPPYFFQQKLRAVKQIPKRFWCFAVGRYMDDGGRRDAYLLLDSVDEASQTYRRIGSGECSVDSSAFKEMGDDKREITLI